MTITAAAAAAVTCDSDVRRRDRTRTHFVGNVREFFFTIILFAVDARFSLYFFFFSHPRRTKAYGGACEIIIKISGEKKKRPEVKNRHAPPRVERARLTRTGTRARTVDGGPRDDD